MLLVFTKMCVKATSNGETFVAGPKDIFVPDDQAKPKFFAALLPILVLLVIFNILKVNISLSILLTALVSAALFPRSSAERR